MIWSPFSHGKQQGSALAEFVLCMIPLSFLFVLFHKWNERLIEEEVRLERGRLQVFSESPLKFQAVENERVLGADKPDVIESEIPDFYWRESHLQGFRVDIWNKTKNQIIKEFVSVSGLDLKNQHIASDYRLTRIYGRSAYHSSDYEKGILLGLPFAFNFRKMLSARRAYGRRSDSFLDRCHARFTSESTCEKNLFILDRPFARQIALLARAAIAFDELSLVTGPGSAAKSLMTKALEKIGEGALSQLLQSVSDMVVEKIGDGLQDNLPTLESIEMEEENAP